MGHDSNNVADGGVFLDGAQPIKAPGNDGLVNTADDGATQIPAGEFTREIDINPLNFDGTATVNPNLREVRVVVRYKVAGAWFTLRADHLHLVVLLAR